MQRVWLSSEQGPVHKLGHSQMTLSPKFRLRVRTKSPTDEPGEVPLIPGLADDVALNCLLRLPVNSLATCRLVCRSWRSALGTRELFFTARAQYGLSTPWLFVSLAGSARWHVLDLTHSSWHEIPPLPCRTSPPQHRSSATVLQDGALIVCGIGADLKFEMRRNRWSPVASAVVAAEEGRVGTMDVVGLPERIHEPLVVAEFGPTVYVVGRGLHVAVGHISRLNGECGPRFGVEWRHVIEAPERFSDLTPSSSHVLFG